MGTPNGFASAQGAGRAPKRECACEVPRNMRASVVVLVEQPRAARADLKKGCKGLTHSL